MIGGWSIKMFEPEYRVGFQVLRKEMGLCNTLKVAFPAALKSLRVSYNTNDNADEAEKTKAQNKNHFKLLAMMYKELEKTYGRQRTNGIMQKVLMEGGRVFFRGFTVLKPGEGLKDFAQIYKDFESKNLVFDVIEESDQRFEAVVNRCLIYESFNELGVADLTKWMCDIAFDYFNTYHPKMTYAKDRMIARGDKTCHEVFTWQD